MLVQNKKHASMNFAIQEFIEVRDVRWSFVRL